MENPLKICLVCNDDWETLYVDGKKAAENHTLSADHILEALAEADSELIYQHICIDDENEDGHSHLQEKPDTLSTLIGSLDLIGQHWSCGETICYTLPKESHES